MLDKLTERCRKILRRADFEAKRRNSDFIGTEHILLGILDEEGSVAFKALSDMGVHINGMKAEIERILERAERSAPTAQAPTAADLPLTPRAKRVFEIAEEQAAKMLHQVIATEHLLLGIAMEDEGLGAKVLTNVGIKVERLRDKIIEIVGQTDLQWQANIRATRARQKLSEIQQRISTMPPGPCSMRVWIFKDTPAPGKAALVFQNTKAFVSDIITVEGVPFDKQEAIAEAIAKECGGATAYLIEPYRSAR